VPENVKNGKNTKNTILDLLSTGYVDGGIGGKAMNSPKYCWIC
jgi:hypothetical protein